MISLLVAYTKDKRVIGAQGKIPWNIPSERNRFKEICRDKYVIMGRKSFEEIGKPLPYCSLIVVSKTIGGPSTGSGTTSYSGTTEKLQFAHSLEEAFEYCKACNQKEILVAGGESIYRQTLPYATKIYATEIDADFNGDTFFPELDDTWTSTRESTYVDCGIKYSYLTFIKQDF